MEEFEIPKLDAIEIPDKTHFKIGEVAKLLDLEPYVLRYWEKEFDILEPGKTDSGQRAYQRDDIELLATIRELLYTEMFTIDGARRQLERAREGKPSYLTAQIGEETSAGDEKLEELREENERLRGELERVEGEELTELREENERLRSTMERVDSERARYEARVEELEGDLEEAREATGGADEERLAEWRERAREFQSENETLRTRLAEAESRVEDLERENAELEQLAADDEPEPEVVEALRGQVSQLERLADSSSATST